MKLKQADRMIKVPYSRMWIFLLFTSLIMVSTSFVPSDAMKLAVQSSHNLEDFIFSIYVVNVNGKNLVRLTKKSVSSGGPSWSPDGSQIAFASDQEGDFDIYVMTATGGNSTNLTRELKEDISPSWSPDGSRIAFSSGRDNDLNTFDIYVMNSDGTHQTRLTEEPESTD